MGDYSTICALSGLPISKGDRVKKLILRSAKPDHLYWIPELIEGWKPLLLPITGYYENCHGSIENVDEDVALTVLYKYFKSKSVFCVNLKDHGYHPEYAYGNREFRNRIISSLIRAAKDKKEVQDFLNSELSPIEEFPFKWAENDWDDFCVQLVEQHPIFQRERKGMLADDFRQHSYCLMLDEVFQYAVNAMEHYRERYTELFYNTLNNFLFPYSSFRDYQRHYKEDLGPEAESIEDYFAKGGPSIFDKESEEYWIELHARVTSCDRYDQFGHKLTEAIEQSETLYVEAARTKDSSFIKAMVDMLLLDKFTNSKHREGISHVWHPLRTYSIYEQNLKEVFNPWNKFKLELGERRYQAWLEEYGPEEE